MEEVIGAHSDRQFVEWVRTQAFEVSAAPYLVLDRGLRIRAVNEAYQQATLQPAEALLGCEMFEAFPDNPHTPEAHSVANLGRSLETVLRFGVRQRMAIQRYDVPVRGSDGTFVRKVWRPINSPLRDRRAGIVGVLHHVEDITAAVDHSAPQTPAASIDEPAVEDVAAALAHEQQVTAELREQNENLHSALQSSRQIAMAIGIVMSSYKVTDTTAFDMIRDLSQETHRKIRDLALDIIEQGHLDI